ncbi:amidohydrolase family protein [Oceanobacillus sp. CAU 1775]
MKAIDIRVRLPQEFRPKVEEEDFYGRYDEVLNVLDNNSKTLADLELEMEQAKVGFAVIHAEYEFGDTADEMNEALAKIVAKQPDKFAGFGAVSLNNLEPMRVVEQAKTIHKAGLKGINLQPVFFNVDPLDAKLYPLYATASELGLIISFHTGIHYSTQHSLAKNSPIFIDQIASDFPDLKIIACHGGWPWVHEMVAVARRHANVYIEFGGVAPKYIGRPGSGWDPLFQLMNNLLSNQVLFGTDWPVIPMERAVEEWKNLGLKDEVVEKLLYKNALNLLGMKEGDR